MPVYLNGGTLYPQSYGGYDLSPEEQALIEAAANGRTVANAGPNTSAMLQDLMGRALYERQVAEQQYRQRQEDERQQILKEQDQAMQEQAAQADFGRTSKLIKAKELAGVVQQQAGNPSGMISADLGALANELDNILGMNQPKNTGVSPYTNTIRDKSGKVIIGTGTSTKTGPTLADKIRLRQQMGARSSNMPEAKSSAPVEVPGVNPKSLGGKAVAALGSEDVGNRVKKGLNDIAQVHPLVKAASLAFSKDPSEITLDDIAKLIKSFSPIGSAMELQKVWNQAVAPEMFKK